MIVKLYLDEDSMDRGLAAALSARGIDVITVLEAGMISRDDEEHLEHATTLGRVVYTFNIPDFARLHAAYQQVGKTHAGMILAPQQQYSIGEQLRRLVRLIGARSAEDMVNRVEYLSSWA